VVVDALGAAGEPVSIRGKLAFGKLSKDVEDETVELWQKLETRDGGCRWKALGQKLTDDDGRVTFTVAASTFEGPGPHRVRVYLLGDLSYAEAKVWVLAPEAPTVLFDIDGTLTKDDGELFEDMLGGKAEMWPAANQVASRWVELGYLPVYITGRPYPLRRSTLIWLAQHRFPLGPVITVDSVLDFLPGEGHVGTFKLKALTRLVGEVKLRFHRAYGNAATDVCAYARSGIAPERTYILGKRRAGCDAFAAPHFLPSYVEHLPTIGEDQRVPRAAAPNPPKP
jgi:phosphatidate phosphatase PAH1